MIGVDFVIEVDDRVCLVIGWADQVEMLSPVLTTVGESLAPEAAHFFERSDLKDRIAEGFIFIFRLPASTPDLALRIGDLTIDIPQQRLVGDWAPFVKGCVDEVFCEFVLALVEGAIKISDPGKHKLLVNRLLALQTTLQEDRHSAIAMDRAAFSAALGFGLCSGWILKTDDLTTRVRAFVIGEKTLQRVPLIENALHHHGLQDYPESFMKTGLDGYFCILQPGPGAPPPPKVFLIVRSDRRGQMVCRPVRTTGRQNMMRYMEDISLLNSHADLVEEQMRLGDALDPAVSVARGCALTQPVRTDPVAILLDHDASDPDVREVLRLICERHDGRIILQPIAGTVGPKFRQGLRGAMVEAGDGRIEVRPPSYDPDFRALALEAAVTVYGRSSTIIQLGKLSATIAAVANGKALSAVIHDPLLRGAGIGERAPLEGALAALIGGNAPFHAAIRTDLLAATYPQIAETFLTLDARIRSLVLVAAKAGREVDLSVSDSLHCFPGRRTIETSGREDTARVQYFHDHTLFASLNLGART